MKQPFLFIFLIPLTLFSQPVFKKKRVLFLGNSLTYVNNLPALIDGIALTNGDTLIYDSNTPGGYTLNNHFNDAASLSKINASLWNYVILQAQSQEPSFPPAQVSAQTMPYAVKLDSAIKQHDSCTITVFYETFGAKHGDASNCQGYPVLCTYQGIQGRLKQSYKKFADTAKGLMSPVGEAFRRSILLDSALELYNADGIHPSLAGSYLAANVFYEVLFQKSCLTTTYNPGLAANTGTFLRQVAHQTVRDSLALWNIGINLPWADYDTAAASANHLQSLSPGLSNLWYFGDGTSSSMPDPSHNYTLPGIYTVSHVVWNGCNKDSVSNTLRLFTVGYAESTALGHPLVIYPDPCVTTLQIKNADPFKNNGSVTEIKNTLGEMVYRSAFTEVLNLGELKNGLYFISIFNSTGRYNARFIKGN